MSPEISSQLPVAKNSVKIEAGTVVKKEDAGVEIQRLLQQYNGDVPAADNMGVELERTSGDQVQPPIQSSQPEPPKKGSEKGFNDYMVSQGILTPEILSKEDIALLRANYEQELTKPQNSKTHKRTTAEALAEKAKKSDPNQLGVYQNKAGTFYAKPKFNKSGEPESFTAYKVNEKGEAVDSLITGSYGINGEVIINGQNKTSSLEVVPKDYFVGIAMAAKERVVKENIPQNEQSGNFMLRVAKNQLDGVDSSGKPAFYTDGVERGYNYGEVTLDKNKPARKNFFER